MDNTAKKIWHYRDSGMSRARLVEIYGEPAVMLALGDKPKPQPEATPLNQSSAK